MLNNFLLFIHIHTQSPSPVKNLINNGHNIPEPVDETPELLLAEHNQYLNIIIIINYVFNYVPSIIILTWIKPDQVSSVELSHGN